MNKVYLDNVATTPIDLEVIKTMQESMRSIWQSIFDYQFGRKAKTIVENARKSIAKVLNVNASEIIFTSGGTEADNLILYNAVTNLE